MSGIEHMLKPHEDAGVRFARALKHRRACEIALAETKRALDAAEDALLTARAECDQASKALTELAER